MSEKSSSVRWPWLESQRTLARIARPLRDFLNTEVAGGVVLLLATAAALVWVNSPFGETYGKFWHTEIGLTLGSFHVSDDLRHWINDGLMTLFFFVVGLEIKREFRRGELKDPRRALLPLIAALGGMVFPVVIYLFLNAGGPASHGWGVPMATDIAFSVGVLTLLGDRVPSSFKVFLLSLAIVDDIGAILVIAVFYAGDISFQALGVAVAGLILMGTLRRMRVWWIPAYVFVGLVVWAATLESGVHATIAGVAVAFMTPVAPLDPAHRMRLPRNLSQDDGEAGDGSMSELDPQVVQEARVLLHLSTPVAEHLEHLLHPWTSYLVVPLFALANAGVPLDPGTVGGSLTSRLALGVILGLVVGKTLGIASFSWLAAKLGVVSLPKNMNGRVLLGLGGLGGIGFTVALFIAGLAFQEETLREQAKIGILAGSICSAAMGVLLLRWVLPSREAATRE